MGSKILRKICILVLLFIQAIFLFAIFHEHIKSWYLMLFIIAGFPLILVAYLRGQLHHHEHQYEHILVVCWIPVAAVCCFFLNHYAGLGSVIAASLVGTFASLIPLFNAKSGYLKQLPAAMYCGAFVGMSNINVAKGVPFVLMAGFFTALLIMVSKSLFSGVGGKLGTLAFAGVVITSFVFYLISSYA